eukprot:9254860-Pyramimonas_sp.AAC.1
MFRQQRELTDIRQNSGATLVVHVSGCLTCSPSPSQQGTPFRILLEGSVPGIMVYPRSQPHPQVFHAVLDAKVGPVGDVPSKPPPKTLDQGRVDRAT